MRIGVWGAGREIRSFAAQLAERLPGAAIAVIASDERLDPGVAGELGAPGARLVSGREIVDGLATCEVIVRSPGVSVHRPELVELRRRGVAVSTATGLWLAETGGAGVIGVTGTKGKSTTAALICHLLRAAGRAARLVGNIGLPALDLLGRAAGELAVVELSSFQIADLSVGPEVIVITNIHPEHADWHGSLEAYTADKLRVLDLTGVRASVLNARDPKLRSIAGQAPAPTMYGWSGGWDVSGAGVALDGVLALSWADLRLRGEHNGLNVCAALAGLDAYGVGRPALPGGLSEFAGLPHRLEVVAEEEDGVIWVDDSISTTPESTLAALASFPDRGLVLIAGGQDRGQDYARLAGELAARGAAVVGLPMTGERLIRAARAAGVPASRAVEAGDMAEAVRRAGTLAGPGGAVLLSPAAPSYNSYRNFEERGDDFGVRIAERYNAGATGADPTSG